MSVVGVDFGTLNTVIAVARNRGVDVITNETSNRATPTLVGFGPKSRYIGEAAKTQEVSNFKNTVGSLKRLAGRALNDPDVEIEKTFTGATLVDVHGQVGAEVSYVGKKETFTATQLVAMYLNKIKGTASAELKLPVSDIVISVPPWFTDVQRRAIIDASEIAGLKILRLINDNTATALGYGITKLDLPGPEEKPKRVCFVDVGHSSYSCSIVEFRKGELNVKATTWDRHFGGRNIDKALVDHLAAEFKTKYKIDIYSNPKALLRVTAAAEKMKKVLSANAQAPMSVESLMNDVDVQAMIKREEMEELVKPLLERVTVPLEQALADAKLKPEDIDAVEMVGGSTRVPSIKDAVAKFFGKTLSYTLNQDEAVARGCAFSCAILSPVFRVRDFSIHDMVSYPIEFRWEKSPDIPDEDTNLTVFNKGNTMPSTKILTFYRKHPFDLEAQYSKPETLPGKMNPWIGRFSVKGVKADDKDDFMICKLKARLNLNGVLNVESGYWIEDVEVEEPIPEENEGEKKEGDVRDNHYHSILSESVPKPEAQEDELASTAPTLLTSTASGHERKRTYSRMESFSLDAKLTSGVQAMDTDPPANGNADAKPKTRKVKKQMRKGDLPISAGTSSLDQATKDAAAERESQMFMEDKLVIDTEDKKNELESYIYELRAKIDEVYAEFASEEEKTKLKEKLEASEDWLYEDGDDTTKSAYIAKMDEIRFVAGPIVQRHLDKLEEERQARLKEEEERAAKIRAEVEARKKAEEEKKAAEEGAKKKEDGGKAEPAAAADQGAETKDAEMKDADGKGDVEAVD